MQHKLDLASLSNTFTMRPTKIIEETFEFSFEYESRDKTAPFHFKAYLSRKSIPLKNKCEPSPEQGTAEALVFSTKKHSGSLIALFTDSTFPGFFISSEGLNLFNLRFELSSGIYKSSFQFPIEIQVPFYSTNVLLFSMQLLNDSFSSEHPADKFSFMQYVMLQTLDFQCFNKTGVLDVSPELLLYSTPGADYLNTLSRTLIFHIYSMIYSVRNICDEHKNIEGSKNAVPRKLSLLIFTRLNIQSIITSDKETTSDKERCKRLINS
ncbi:hypothetical protein HMI56_006610 [Coelomomyces lativittatus]|nr:hypothetical protein HMI56_006610 [Coelomomyces lativittatus]